VAVVTATKMPVPPTGLRSVRLMKGWRIGALAQDADVAVSPIRRLETGLTKEPSQKTCKALAKVLEVSPSKLFGSTALKR